MSSLVRLRWMVTSCAGAALVPALLSAQTAAPRPDCKAAEYRQFDFWLGDWNVTTGPNQAGTNLITLTLDGCVLHEHWAGAKGGRGESFNYYDRDDRQWHQLWVDNSGGTIELAGTLHDGTMVLVGSGKDQSGNPVLNRIAWIDNPKDGSVRQLWEQSSDNGKTWQPAFDGLYRKKSS